MWNLFKKIFLFVLLGISVFYAALAFFSYFAWGDHYIDIAMSDTASFVILASIEFISIFLIIFIILIMNGLYKEIVKTVKKL